MDPLKCVVVAERDDQPVGVTVKKVIGAGVRFFVGKVKTCDLLPQVVSSLFLELDCFFMGGAFAVLEAVIWYQAASFYSFNTE